MTVGRGVLSATAGGLSFAAQLAQATAGMADTTKAAADQQASVQATLEARLDAMRQRIERHLAERGIQLQAPVELMSDGLGGIEIASPHPPQAALHDALGSDVLLERDFNQLLADCRDFSEDSGLPLAASLTIPKSAPRT